MLAYIAANENNKHSNDMKEQILKILDEGKKYGYSNEAVAGELLGLFSISGSAYRDNLLDKAKSMKETGELFHSNKIYKEGINTALDNFETHINELFKAHYR